MRTVVVHVIQKYLEEVLREVLSSDDFSQSCDVEFGCVVDLIQYVQSVNKSYFIRRPVIF